LIQRLSCFSSRFILRLFLSFQIEVCHFSIYQNS
jgi:hypothetical protein